MPAAIDPSAIPGKDIDPDAIALNATTVGTIATQVRDSGAAVHRKWQGMAAVYVAPEAGTVLDLMSPVNSQATLVGDNLGVVSAALSDFAEAVRPIKAALDQLRLDAEAFRAEIAGGVSVREINPAWQSAQYSGSWNAYGAASDTDVEQYRTVTKEWHEVQEYVDRNNALIRDVNAQQVLLWDAERDCANKIRALYGADPLRSAQSEDDPLAYGLDEIPEGTEMPWGAEVERTEGCGEATAKFVFKDFLWEGIVVGGIWGTVEGLGTLTLGYNPETGGFFDGEVWGAAWSGLGMIVASGAMNTGVLAPLFQADAMMEQFGGGFLPQEVRDFKAQADETAINAGKALIAWDKWQDDPGTALGESVFNIGTALIPGGAAVAGVKTAGTAASVMSKIARFVDLVDPTTWVLNGGMKLGGTALGSLDNLIGKIDTPSLDVHLGHPEVYTAMDVDSAMRTLDEWGVDMNDVYARVDANGTPVLEFPGGAIELPDGAFGGGIRASDGGADAAVTAPVREPELVNAGGVRGETGSAPVNSIVDDAPVRTETGGTGGDSTVVREPETATGGSGESGNANGGDGSAGGSHPGGPAAGGADAPPPHGVTLADGSHHVPTTSRDSLASQASAERFLAEKAAEHGLTVSDLHRLIHENRASALSRVEARILLDIRESLPMPAPGELMQKVLDGSTAQKMLDGVYAPDEVGGFVARAADTQRLVTNEDYFYGLGLDYKNSSFVDASGNISDVYSVRFAMTDDLALNIPDRTLANAAGEAGHYHPDGMGPSGRGNPYLGNGFVGRGEKALIPEYHLSDRVPAYGDGAEMWRIGADGQEHLVAVLRNAEWVRVR